jgi:tRNA G46 methylase TrmB
MEWAAWLKIASADQKRDPRALADYAPYFDGASNVLDIGCGRGEFWRFEGGECRRRGWISIPRW